MLEGSRRWDGTAGTCSATFKKFEDFDYYKMGIGLKGGIIKVL